MDILNSVEFYVIIITVAILLFSFILRPSGKGEAQTYFFNGESAGAGLKNKDQQIIIESGPNGEITFTHTNIDIPDNSGINFVVTIIGSDIKITEKVYENNHVSMTPESIRFTGDCFRSMRYHIFYESPYCGKWASCYYTNDAENHIIIDMKL